MKKLFLLTLVSKFVIGTTMAQIPTSGLVGYYPFNGNSNDMSGTGNNGIVNGAVLTPDRFGNANSAYNFNGSSYIQVADNSSLNFGTGSFAISAWVNSSVDSSQMIMHKGSDFSTPQYYLRINENATTDLFFMTSTGVLNDSYTDYGNNVSIENNQWHHIVAQRKVDTLQLFFDNVLIYSAQKTLRNVNNSNPLFIGTQNFGPGNFFKGMLDDIAIYNRALTTTEIQQLFSINCVGISSTIKSYGPTTFCAGSNVLLSAPSTYSAYQWKRNGVAISGANTNAYTATVTGTYKCVLTCGVSTSTSNGILLTRLDNASNSITSTGSIAFCAGDSILLSSTNTTPGYTYQWYRSNISINGETGINYTAKNPGTYKVVSINPANGCSRLSTNSISTVVNCRMGNPGLISGPVEKQVKNLNVFPNPNNGSFTLEYLKEDTEDGTATIEILNTLGKTIYSSRAEFVNGQLSQEINLQNDFSKGIYFVNILLNGEKIGSKVLLQ